MDIVLEEESQQTGLLAQNAEEFVDAILEVIRMPASDRLKMAVAVRQREQRFYHDFKAAIQAVLSKLRIE